MGRRSTYTEELAREICERLAEGETLASICRSEHMPSTQAVYDWRDANEGFKTRFARAREVGFDAIADQCVAISEDSSADYIETENGRKFDPEHVQRSKLRIETRLKLLAKWDPKRYGEKVTHASDAENPLFGRLVVEVVDPKKP
jgi:hypothetical protein